MNSYEVFLFDFDGTLFDTLDSSIYVFEEAYRRMGVAIDRNEVLRLTREPISVSYKRIMGNMDNFDKFIEHINELVFSDKVTNMAVIYDDTKAVLNYLKDNKKIIGIVTSNAKDHLLDVLRRFNLENSFDVIVGNREASVPKPSPIPILKALELLDYKDKEKVVYIGDSLNDALAAVNAGVKPVLLDRLDEFGELEDYKIINSLNEIKG